jgi:predicted nuclease of predicted toxin-antitoxin system
VSARFLCDENISGALVRALAARGRDVLWIAATAPGMSDPAVLALAREQGRVLITA